MEEEEEERRTTTRRRTRREEYVEADRRKISRGTHGRSVLVAGGWRIGRVAMEKRAGGIPRVRRLGPPQRETPIREIRGVATPNLPRCRRFSSAWLIDSATNQRPRRSSTSSSPPLCFSSFTARVSLSFSLFLRDTLCITTSTTSTNTNTNINVSISISNINTISPAPSPYRHSSSQVLGFYLMPLHHFYHATVSPTSALFYRVFILLNLCC